MLQERGFHFESLMTAQATSIFKKNHVPQNVGASEASKLNNGPHSYRRSLQSQKAKNIKSSMESVLFDSP